MIHPWRNFSSVAFVFSTFSERILLMIALTIQKNLWHYSQLPHIYTVYGLNQNLLNDRELETQKLDSNRIFLRLVSLDL